MFIEKMHYDWSSTPTESYVNREYHSPINIRVLRIRTADLDFHYHKLQTDENKTTSIYNHSVGKL
jgi:hypothetical protein